VLKKFRAEAHVLSTSPNRPPKDYDKVDADDYLFHEDQEKIHFLIKSRKDEYCFTNLALVHVDGDSAVSSKRTIKRYDYAQHPIGPVPSRRRARSTWTWSSSSRMGDRAFSIDVRKDHLEALKDIYKALHTIGKLQHRDAVGREHAAQSARWWRDAKLNAAHDPARAGVLPPVLEAMNGAVLDYHTRRDIGRFS
jgi:hypothetical protein